MKIIDTNKLNRFWKNGVKPIKDSVAKKLDTSKVINNLLTTKAGYALDARQGKVLQDQISEINTTYIAATAAPKAAGTAAVGTSAKYAREDHVHPSQTTVSGNAGSATKLATARKINGVAFDGTKDITVDAEFNLRKLTHRYGSVTTTETYRGYYKIASISLTTNNDSSTLICKIFHINEYNVSEHPMDLHIIASKGSSTNAFEIYGDESSVVSKLTKSLFVKTPANGTGGEFSIWWKRTANYDMLGLTVLGMFTKTGGAETRWVLDNANTTVEDIAEDGFVVSAFNSDADNITMRTSIVTKASEATKLSTARTIRTNLASTSTASFDGSANAAPGVTGTLPIANGGTGNTTGLAASATKLATARALKIGNTSKNFDGSAGLTWTLADIGAAASSHTHSEYAASNHTHTGYASSTHNHDSVYAKTSHTHNYAASNHNHDSVYAKTSHNHNGTYLPIGGGTLQGHLNVNADNTLIFGGSSTNLLNVYTRNIECTTGELYMKGSGGLNLTAPSHISCLPYNGGAGYIRVRASGYDTPSSRKVKDNIQDMTDKEASKILSVRTVSFDYKDMAGGEHDQRGVIAEEVKDIIPYAVYVPDGYDEDSDDIYNVPSVDYSKFVPYLIKMVQIQQKQIDELKSLTK